MVPVALSGTEGPLAFPGGVAVQLNRSLGHIPLSRVKGLPPEWVNAERFVAALVSFSQLSLVVASVHLESDNPS